MALERLAPAKVNLFLHVGPPGQDGYHPVSSLMVFADIGDRVSFVRGGGDELVLTGPFAAGLSAGADNLILRARDSLLGGRQPTWGAFHLVLDKQLPIASGLGGGSADAAATLRLLREALAPTIAEDVLYALARNLGSDVPACLEARAVIATGRGEQLGAAPPFPDLRAVLVNPCLPSPTGAVYKAYDRAVSAMGVTGPDWPTSIDAAEEMARHLSLCRNDLEAPAVALQPAIGEVLAALAAQSETLFARMSGSGATCFSLCRSAPEAARLAARLAEARPDWWVRACTLRGSRS